MSDIKTMVPEAEEGLALAAENDRLMQELGEARTDAKIARSGEAYRKRETDRCWALLRACGAIDSAGFGVGGNLDKYFKRLIDSGIAQAAEIERLRAERDL